jgi:hypothetical protein
MVERLSQKETPAIRFHHIGYWRHVVKEYANRFKGVMPWELPEEGKDELRLFISDQCRSEMETGLLARKYLNKLSLTEPKPHITLVDIEDTSLRKRKYEKLVNKKMEALSGIFNTAIENKGNKILLTMEPDRICDGCTVGKYCTTTFLERLTRNNEDYRFRDALERITKLYEFKPYLQKRGVEKLGRNLFSITAEVLFDDNFHRLLWLETYKYDFYAFTMYQ